MKTMLFSLILLAGLLGSLVGEDLEGMAFVFPAPSNTAHVVLNATIKHPLNSFTVCMRSFTEKTHGYSLFSYATKRDANAILLFVERPRKYVLYVRSQSVSFDVPEKFSSRTGGDHICVSWEAASGLVEFWMNGQPLVRKSLKRVCCVSNEASIILGQEQDSFGGGFDTSQSYVGEISEVNMWGRALSPDEVSMAWNNANVPEYLMNWEALNYTIHGDVLVKAALSSSNRGPF
ncbi:C-reactive protein-like [Paroedura picta]|uniref:C-reactive protein-like n=1 Tax=Paroedura picta TaxID=143630 RepID=UPI004056C757